MKFISNLVHFLSKKASRKNLYKFISEDVFLAIQNNEGKKLKILNIGSGGDIEKILKNFKDDIELYNIDIDVKRNPDQLLDITDDNFNDKIKFKPDLVTLFEVLEHVNKPEKAIKNIYNILEDKKTCLCSVPFIFHIHDEPNDFFRFTKFGLKLIFKEFKTAEIKERNGWLDTIFVILIRFIKEKYFLTKILGLLFLTIYLLLYPFIQIIQKIFKTNKITTGYFVKAIK
tara:strand:+ start:367 stop:1053 length:687 start_codon:yes stop_codon:yes gene_type:complete